MTDPQTQREHTSIKQLTSVSKARQIRLQTERKALAERERVIAQVWESQSLNEDLLAQQRAQCPQKAASAGEEQRNGGVGPVGISTQSLRTVGKDQKLEGIARAQYGENWRAGLAQVVLDNGFKLNQWGSPVLRPGQALVLSDLSGKSEQELASLSYGRCQSSCRKSLMLKRLVFLVNSAPLVFGG